MDSALGSVGLPIALAIVMFGLGLSLTVEDFRRTAREPKAVAIALGTQLLVLPLCASVSSSCSTPRRLSPSA